MQSSDREHPVILLRNQLIELRQGRATRQSRHRQYGLTSQALVAYINNESLRALRVPSYELFLLQGED